MKKLLSTALLVIVFIQTSAQTLDQKYSAHIYLGAPKSALIEFAVQEARAWYLSDTEGVIKKQKKKGVHLKKKEQLENFLDEMEKDIRDQLDKNDYWGYNSYNKTGVDFGKYFLYIETLVSKDFFIPIFSEIKLSHSSKDLASLSFRNGKLSSIYTSISIAYSLDQSKVIAYDNKTIGLIEKKIRDFYSANFSARTVNGQRHWNSETNQYPSASVYYGMNDGKRKIDISLYFLPYGRQTGPSSYQHQGTSLQSVSFHAQLN